MIKTLFALTLVVLTFLGIFDASFLTYQKMAGVIPPCSAQFQCETVLTSSWSQVGPIPVSAFGILFYLVFFLISLCFYLNIQKFRLGKIVVPIETLLFIFGLSGAAFSTFFIFLMAVIIKAWCLYCLVSAGMCFTLATLTSINFFYTNRKAL